MKLGKFSVRMRARRLKTSLKIDKGDSRKGSGRDDGGQLA
jgi:hypothetical protein